MDIVEELRQNREAGAKRLEAEYKAGLMSLARRFCLNDGDAEELVNATFAKVVDNIDDYFEKSAFFAWMCQILTNLFRDGVRRKSNQMEVYPGEVPDVADDNARDAIYANLDASLLRDAISTLPPKMKDVVVMRYFMDLPLARIAKLLAVPEGTVNSRLRNARLALAAKLGVAARKPGGRVVLLALALCCLTALGAGIYSLASAADASTKRPQDEAEVAISWKQPCQSDADGGRIVDASLPDQPSQPDPSDSSVTTGGTGDLQLSAADNLSTFNLSTFQPSSEGETMKSTTTTRAAAMLAAALATSAVAEDYTLAAGETDTFSDGAVHTYGTATIAGDLAIRGNTKFTAEDAVNLAGGTVTVNGNTSVFGHRSHRDINPGVTATLSPAAADGRYTKVTLQNGVAYGFAVGGLSDYANFAAKKLVIEADTAATREAYPDGVFDFLETTGSGGGANFCEVENNSSLTGRVSVAGTSSMFGCGNGNTWGAGFFKSGNFLLDIASGKTLRFNASDKGASYNQAGCGVLATGEGNLLFLQRYNSGTTMKTAIRSGAVLDVSGTVTFDCSSTASGAYGWFTLADDGVFGPNVGKIMTADVVGKHAVFLEVPTGVAVTVHDVDVKRDGDGLIGAGTVRIDASAAARTFEANIPATYGSGTANTLTIAKTGAYEATIAATNLPALSVEAGILRLTTNCVIGALSGADGATLVADGCTVTLPAVSTLGGLGLATANGGAFRSASGSAMLYGPGTFDGTLRIASGDFTASAYGLSQKYLRWTFSKTVTSPNPLHIARLWVFGSDGNRVATGLVEAIENDNTAASSIREGRVAWEYSSATNIAASSSQWFYGKGLLYKVFNNDFTTDHNHYPHLTSPVVDPGNSDSWIGFAVHRKSAEANATGYNIEIGNYANAPSSWTVEASEDGETWTQVDSRENLTPASTTAETLYDGETAAAAQARGAPLQHFLFGGYVSGGLEADAAKAVTLQVDEGASVDLTAFTAAPQKIGGLVVDFAEGGGTVTGGAIGLDGTLTILNGNQSFGFGTPLPLTLSGVADTANLREWSISVDGEIVKGRVRLDADGHPVVAAFGTVIYFR